MSKTRRRLLWVAVATAVLVVAALWAYWWTMYSPPKGRAPWISDKAPPNAGELLSFGKPTVVFLRFVHQVWVGKGGTWVDITRREMHSRTQARRLTPWTVPRRSFRIWGKKSVVIDLVRRIMDALAARELGELKEEFSWWRHDAGREDLVVEIARAYLGSEALARAAAEPGEGYISARLDVSIPDGAKTVSICVGCIAENDGTEYAVTSPDAPLLAEFAEATLMASAKEKVEIEITGSDFFYTFATAQAAKSGAVRILWTETPAGTFPGVWSEEGSGHAFGGVDLGLIEWQHYGWPCETTRRPVVGCHRFVTDVVLRR